MPSRVGWRNHVLDKGAHSHNLANTLELFCVAAMQRFCQITLTRSLCYLSSRYCIQWQQISSHTCTGAGRPLSPWTYCLTHHQHWPMQYFCMVGCHSRYQPMELFTGRDPVFTHRQTLRGWDINLQCHYTIQCFSFARFVECMFQLLSRQPNETELSKVKDPLSSSVTQLHNAPHWLWLRRSAHVWLRQY